VRAARRGFVLDVGVAESFTPVIDADDAAAAVVAALGAPAGVYDVVDDDPLTRAQQSAALAAGVGRRRLWRAPKWAAPKISDYLAASQRVSNRAFREATSWRPSSPSLREGYRKVVQTLRFEPALPSRVRLMLWVLMFSAFGVGVQAEFFPRSFYDDFPLGRGWVAMDGRYNEHLIRDVGALNLALLVLTIGAIFVGTPRDLAHHGGRVDRVLGAAPPLPPAPSHDVDVRGGQGGHCRLAVGTGPRRDPRALSTGRTFPRGGGPARPTREPEPDAGVSRN